MVVSSIESKKDFIVDISPVRDSPNELGEKFKGALVSIIDPDYSERLDVKCLKNLYLLTEAELDILQYVIDGYSNVQISQVRSVSPETVKKQVSNVLLKVGARGRTQLVRKVLSVILPLDI
ncbi:helix-turn-helix transcriptional regulator [Granulosicoccus sp.]|nr:helix-turn-helix transcriptional regulator [Granulosicoccus sp.]MDB4223860.1 helix-turn-helix transcriptional regulator [Granulosicoccus sp.]